MNSKRLTWGYFKDVPAKEGVVVQPALRVALVACGKSKLDRAAPAAELYTGNLFRAQLAHAIAEFGRDNVLILSAKHGLVALDTVLEPYDVTLVGARTPHLRGWADKVCEQLVARFGERCVDLHAFAGVAYVQPLKEARRWLGRWSLVDELKGLQMGERLAWFKARRAPVAAPAPAAQDQADAELLEWMCELFEQEADASEKWCDRCGVEEVDRKGRSSSITKPGQRTRVLCPWCFDREAGVEQYELDEMHEEALELDAQRAPACAGCGFVAKPRSERGLCFKCEGEAAPAEELEQEPLREATTSCLARGCLGQVEEGRPLRERYCPPHQAEHDAKEAKPSAAVLRFLEQLAEIERGERPAPTSPGRTMGAACQAGLARHLGNVAPFYELTPAGRALVQPVKKAPKAKPAKKVRAPTALDRALAAKAPADVPHPICCICGKDSLRGSNGSSHTSLGSFHSKCRSKLAPEVREQLAELEHELQRARLATLGIDLDNDFDELGCWKQRDEDTLEGFALTPSPRPAPRQMELAL